MDKNKIRRMLVMMTGLIIMGLGIAVFKISLMGNDPCTAMMMAVGDKVDLSLPVIMIVVNSIYFLAEVIWGRHYIGIGTFANWFGVGTIASIWLMWLERYFVMPQTFSFRFSLMLTGILILSLAASMYQTPDLGIAPYDVISIILAEKCSVPYLVCRVFTDSVCALSAYLLGGLIGLGTFACAVGLGPFIAFFNHYVSEKLCGAAQGSKISAKI